MGVMFSQDKTEKRREFVAKATAMAEQIFNNYLLSNLDDAADQMACKFLVDRQPPLALLSMNEIGLGMEDWNELPGVSTANTKGPLKFVALYGRNNDTCLDVDMNDDDGEEDDSAEEVAEQPSNEEGDEGQDGDDGISLETGVKFITPSAVRLVAGGKDGEDDVISLYHALANTNVYHETPETKLRLPIEFAESIEKLYRAYPKFTKVDDLPLETAEEKIEFCKILLEHQILMLE